MCFHFCYTNLYFCYTNYIYFIICFVFFFLLREDKKLHQWPQNSGKLSMSPDIALVLYCHCSGFLFVLFFMNEKNANYILSQTLQMKTNDKIWPTTRRCSLRKIKDCQSMTQINKLLHLCTSKWRLKTNKTKKTKKQQTKKSLQDHKLAF